MGTSSLDRRAFLAAGPLAVGLGALAAHSDSTKPRASLPSGDLRDWDEVRAAFDLDPGIAHFAAFVLAGHPEPVRTAIDSWRQALDTDPEEVLQREFELDAAARQSAADYLGVTADSVALTDSTTMGLGLTYHGLPLERGDHVLTTKHDFYSTHESLRLAAARSGAEVDVVSLYDDAASASAAEIVSRVEAGLRPNTRIVALTWVHSSTGVKLPVRDIADAIAEHNHGRPESQQALLCLDAVHGFGAEDAGPTELGCDVFISGAHKWLFGPRGTGLVWARRPVATAIAPIVPPFYAASFLNWATGSAFPSTFGRAATPGGYHSFEHRWALPEAFALHDAVGRDRVAQRTRELATRLKQGLAEIPDVRLVTPIDEELSAGIVCCEVRGQDPEAVLTRLRRDHRISASVTPYRERLLRFGTSIVTTPDEVDAATDAVEAIAAG
ncbi:MAG: aminotransferase class V-fold PLP-dependent enzyme [Acidimicrobiales bacterium]